MGRQNKALVAKLRKEKQTAAKTEDGEFSWR
jgi:hypothetical protein